jgi:hypothetical protein
VRPCDSIRDSLIDLHYGLIDEPERESVIRGHVAECSACAAQLRSLEQLLGALRRDEAFPREPEVDWETFARTTVGRAAGRGWSWRALVDGLTRPVTVSITPAWAAAASAILILGLGILGYTFLPLTGGNGTTLGPPVTLVLVPEDNLDKLTVNLARKNTAQYLRETRAVLVTILDVDMGCDQDKVDITAERAKAVELLRRQRLVATELSRLPLARAQEVTGDLQNLLLEISSLADCTRSDDIQTLRDVVDKRQILVRMELLTQELDRRTGGSDV